jgi:hypothetical protein
MSLDSEQFSAANVEPQFFEGERQAIALREAAEAIVMTGEDGQKLSGLHFNRDFAGNPAIVKLGGMFIDADNMEQRYAGYQLAVANPENPVIMMNIPAHGESDPLTPAQRKQIIGDRQVSLVAGSQAVAAMSRLEGTGEVITTGQSAGGRLAPDFTVKAGEMGLKPVALVGFEPAGLDKRPSLVTATAFFVDGFLAQRNYHEGTNNLRLDLGVERFKEDMAATGFHDSHDAFASGVGIFEKDPSYIAFLLANSPLSDGGGFEAIERAMDANPDMQAAFVSGGLDKVTRWRKIAPRVQQLTDAYEGRMSWNVWPYDGHSMGIGAQQPRFAAAVRSVMESLED